MDFGAHCSGKWWNTGVQQTLGYWGMRVQRVSGAWGPHLIAVVRIHSSYSFGQNSQFLLLWLESYSFFQLCLQRIGAIRFALKMGKGRSDIKVSPLKLYWIKSNPLFKKFQTFGREFSFKNSSFF